MGDASAGLPLAGLKVLELGHIVAGPTAGQILADMGAEVTKIESLDGGDHSRKMPGAGVAIFHALNRNKRSVAIDLKGEGSDVFLKLAGNADVIIDNFAHGVVERLGVDYAVVSKFNPRIVWLSIKGYLPGPAEASPMMDELAQMAGGLAFMTGPPGQPMRAGASVIDIGAASYGVIAVLAALRQRDLPGERGQHIVAGLFETSAYWVAQWMATAQLSREPSVPMPVARQGKRMGFCVYRLFDTADGSQIFIGLVSVAHWERFCNRLGLDDLRTDKRFALEADRLANGLALDAAIAEIVLDWREAELVQLLLAARVPFAPVRRPDQLAQDYQLTGAGQLMDQSMPDGTRLRLPKLPFRSNRFDMALRMQAPAFGADTVAVLLEQGYCAAEVMRLGATGAILLDAAGDAALAALNR